MEINVTVTKKQIKDLLESQPYQDVLSLIHDMDYEIADWDFTLMIWLYFDNEIKNGIKENLFDESDIERVKNQYIKRIVKNES